MPHSATSFSLACKFSELQVCPFLQGQLKGQLNAPLLLPSYRQRSQASAYLHVALKFASGHFSLTPFFCLPYRHHLL
ncbi:hypothetical protein XENTR_v10010245 [Xenopus tropicalis]|nr:hypothetical protein XENTR_v10010245 [Xenopus tropicalis]